ncbi:MAG TPA: hypothetical protein VFP20_02695 [Bacteroidales bacterium]|nr:hypothetical protein [Bacteroidales bacterium]
MRTSKIFALTGCLLFATLIATAAKTTKPKTTTVVKDSVPYSDGSVDRKFQPVLVPVERILVLPGLEQQKETKQTMVFSIVESPASLKGEYNPLPAAGIQQEFPANHQIGYVRLGVGNHRAFLGDVQLNLLRASTQSFDVNFSHRSIFGEVLFPSGEINDAYHSENNFGMNYRASMNKTVLEASLGERFNFWNNYGKWNAPVADTLKIPGGQWSTDGSFTIGLKSKDLENPVSWAVKSEGHLFRLGNGVSSSTNIPIVNKGGAENEIKLSGFLNYDLSNLLQLGVDAKIRNFSYRLPASYKIDANQAALATQFEDRGYLELTPNATFFYRNWRFKGGFKLSLPSLISESVRPNLIASAITPLGRKVVLSLTLDGGVEPMSYREGISMNPWLDPAIRLRSVWKPYDVKGNLDFRPISNLRVSAEFGMNTLIDAPFFTNALPWTAGINNAQGHLFAVEYMTSTQLHVEINGEYSIENLLTILGSIRTNTFTNSSENTNVDNLLAANGRKAWYMPGVEARLRADVHPVDKLTVFADYRLEALRYAPTLTTFSSKMDPINDLSFGANYKISKEVGILMHVNNLLDQRYQVYYGYPVHGFTALVGGSVSF